VITARYHGKFYNLNILPMLLHRVTNTLGGRGGEGRGGANPVRSAP